ncbi:hypothetical protein Cadr_000024316 [Camelus dromedarius]|uniref:Uncharacterized protein n=1 Tax=Camelus dromedarius TaxID=9838 RepID=A0A5N4CNY9_CAMDR|nr:hypothetical protein Cadr_000024316 [Camelus dromedarius]
MQRRKPPLSPTVCGRREGVAWAELGPGTSLVWCPLHQGHTGLR